MTLAERLDQDLKAAMVKKDAARLSALRFLKSALNYVAIEKRGQPLSDADVMQVIQKQIKQHRESVEQFKAAGRAELAGKEQGEIAVLESFLPKQLSEPELAAAVAAFVKETGAASKKDFGRVMKLAGERLAGQADAKRISEQLGKLLQ